MALVLCFRLGLDARMAPTSVGVLMHPLPAAHPARLLHLVKAGSAVVKNPHVFASHTSLNKACQRMPKHSAVFVESQSLEAHCPMPEHDS